MKAVDFVKNQLPIILYNLTENAIMNIYAFMENI